EGWSDHPVTEQVARIYLAEAFADGFQAADVLLLGCTHYPLLKPLLRRVSPDNVKLVDSAESTAVAVSNLLNFEAEEISGLRGEARRPLKRSQKSAEIRFFVTDSTEKFRRLGTRFLGAEINDITHVDLKE